MTAIFFYVILEVVWKAEKQMLDKIWEISILYDFYGELLADKQREIFRLYHEDNYSLAEIGTEFNMTRQGVHEAVKRSEEKLQIYEKKLNLVSKFSKTQVALAAIDRTIRTLIKEFGENKELKAKLLDIKKIIGELDQ